MTGFLAYFLFLLQNSPLLWVWATIFAGLGVWHAHSRWAPWRKQVTSLELENQTLKTELKKLQNTPPENRERPSPSPADSEVEAPRAPFDRYNRRRSFGEEPTFGCRACERPEQP